ncbi:putative polynucleotide enzyme with nucleotide triphosphate hydrolase domain [Candidatus Competibacter denitrificans Run_A_D11]|uniref:Replication-associated recombination protein A n=1 Tax=Candidatus Competibacter denitrificans Run_A_D11 TaxID=1400863 RepID=W6MDX9_9GAMM|nr:replication-associated recombination protein A [Candidatus Competibacter denitrificans]CDI03643.1 putative polynucleotide enzyme with nucleotide triphosphate hydrolase domain [Candidatus Competibacter denitrificans Run_A_D11]HRC69269.1 replication-associated recombination protein A [Candidatus Competibacter denitrificans]
MPDKGVSTDSLRPLADRLRPRHLNEFVGQDHLLAPGKPLRVAIERGQPHSMVLWGPPGTGKTTLAELLANACQAEFIRLSAVMAGVREIRMAVEQAQALWRAEARRTVLFVDEVYRFNKAQQDAFLPYVEDGTLTFIGATTENPGFALNNALLSRVRVYALGSLDAVAIQQVIVRALHDPQRGLADRWSLTEIAQAQLAHAADGDARRALIWLELAAELAQARDITLESALTEVMSDGAGRLFDRGGDLFYDQISALHKAVRGSSPDAALYWLARMLDGGCDPLYIARRVARMASEDIGNADPRALQLALNAWAAQERMGSPEGELAIAQAVVYLAVAPKSNAVYTAFAAARRDVARHGTLEVPAHLRNAPTPLARELGHGEDYRYPHDEPGTYAAGECYFPEVLREARYYRPTASGLEGRIGEKLERLRELDRQSGRRRYR